MENFATIDATLRPELRQDWENMVKDWQEDQSKPCPYAPSVKCELASIFLLVEAHANKLYLAGITEAQVRLDLRNQELADIAAGRTTSHQTSATAFLVAGLHLEEAQ